MDTAHDFTAHLQELLRRERVALADFVVALAEFDRRRLWIDLGYASLFDFLHRELGLSKASAFYRKRAAELIQRFPDVAEPLRDGRLCLTSVVEVSKVLTDENHDEVLPRFFLLSKREAKVVSAAIRPDEAPPLREVVTVVRAQLGAPTLSPALPTRTESTRELGVAPLRTEAPVSLSVVRPDEPARANSASRPQMTPPGTPSSTIAPLTAELNRLHLTVSRTFLGKLEAARAALSHSHPDASAQELLEAGLDLLLAQHAKRKAQVARPRREPPPSGPGHVPAHVKREVWKRDGGRCQWELESGGMICGSTLRVEIDHRTARARGGPPTVENLRCLCRFHNDLAARVVFGDAVMDRYTRGRRVQRTAGEERLPPR